MRPGFFPLHIANRSEKTKCTRSFERWWIVLEKVLFNKYFINA